MTPHIADKVTFASGKLALEFIPNADPLESTFQVLTSGPATLSMDDIAELVEWFKAKDPLLMPVE